jgi:xylulokinase
MNVHRGEYVEEILSYLEITKNQLPILKESGEVVGEYNGIKVTTSALDQIAGITGAGVVDCGIMSETTGTALAVCALTKEFPSFYNGLKVSVYYVKKGVYCLLMWAPTAGMVMEWFKKNFYPDTDFKTIDEEAAKIPLGAEGLTIAPNMRGSVMPVNDPDLKGGVYGMDLKHTRAHFSRAIMESIACLLRQFLEYLNLPVDEVISIGGGSKSALWRQIKADITGKKVVTLKNKETGCLGTAIYAGYGAGIYGDINGTVEQIVQRKDTTYPKAECSDADSAYQKYLQLDKLFLQRNKA